MQQYIKDWYKSRSLDPCFDVYISCENCKEGKIDDIHHIHQSMRGKRKNNKDGSDLIGLCRDCHEWIHSNNTFENRQNLLFKVKNILGNF